MFNDSTKITVPPKLARPVLMLMNAASPQEHLLAVGKLLLLLPEVPHEQRSLLQAGLREFLDPRLMALGQRFAQSPQPYQLKCMLENTPLEQIDKELSL